jgi:hypothetical protein
MNTMRIERRLAALLLLLLPGVAAAHHGSSISYDTSSLWTTWATVTEFNYKNPHPTMTFDRTTKDGKVEHWVAELLQAPAPLARAGWTRGRSEEALKPGTRVKLYIGTARAGGTSGIVMRLENEKGEEILASLGGRGVPKAVDLDGVPLGLQPSGTQKLPGQAATGQ